MSLPRAPLLLLLRLLLLLLLLEGLLGCGLGDKNAAQDSVSNQCSPGPDLCDLRDNDCDGDVDEDQPSTLVWPDDDSDGYGNTSAAGTAICGTLLGYVANSEDCNDADPDVHPTAWDGCDYQDSDCNGIVDDDDPPYELWPDVDGDGQGDAEADSHLTCVWSSADASNNLDCDDNDLDVYQGAVEICDNKDNDCDGDIDEDDACGDGLTDRAGHGLPGSVVENGAGQSIDPRLGAQTTRGE